MSWVTAAQGGTGPPSVPTDLDNINDEAFLRQLWQQCEDSGDRRRIRGRMYKLREKRLREMIQNDEESLGTLSIAKDDKYGGDESTERKTSKIEIKMVVTDDSAITDSVSMKNVRSCGVTLRGIDPVIQPSSDEDVIEERIKEVSKGRGHRFDQVKSSYDSNDQVILKSSSFSLQSNALSADSYQSMKHKEVRDCASPVRQTFPRDDSDSFFTSDDEALSKNVKTEEFDTSKKTTRKITDKNESKDKSYSPSQTSPTSHTRRTIMSGKHQTSSSSDASPGTSPTRISKRGRSQIGNRTIAAGSRNTKSEGTSASNLNSKNEYNKLDTYISSKIDKGDEIIMEEKEECVDESGNIVNMIVQTIRNRDGTECTSRRIATSTKIVDNESDIDEILIGNPEHEVLERKVEEKEDTDGSKIKIITERRRRPDGIEYATKNVLKTSKIFDYDNPEDIMYCEEDELVHSEESMEMDEQGISTKIVMETRRKSDGIEYITKKVYKTSKIEVCITPSDDDEILDSQETEEEKSDGTIVKIVIEKRKTKNGEIYTHRRIFQSRKLTLSAIEMQEGLPFMDNDDEIIDKTVKEEEGENKSTIKVVFETRRRKDGSTYTFDYILKNLKITEDEINKMPMNVSSSSNINVSSDDELIKEDINEEVQADGSTIKTIIERRRAKDGTQYLRHRIMRFPKLPEPQIHAGSLDDEVLEEDVNERVLEDGTQCKAVTERRRSSVTGNQYILRRMSKVYHPHQALLILEGRDEIVDENITEEDTGAGVLVKTIIRRYQRPNGTFYLTHDIQKSYKSPISVNVEGSDDDELVDRSYDERETSDGILIKTIVETRCRTDGTHYTVERVEKISSACNSVQSSFKGNSIIRGSPGDTIISCEEHEEPNEDGIIIKTIIEVRQKADGTEYTNKTIIKSIQHLVPEHETSYVIIKSEKSDEPEFMPSLDDEIVYTRLKRDIDELGNPITVTIETRQSKKTGEKYNLTKRVHTTDVVLTSQGEKILMNKTALVTGAQETVPYGSVSALKDRFTPIKKDQADKKNITVNRVNTASKKKFFEDAAAKSVTVKSYKNEPLIIGSSSPSKQRKYPVSDVPSVKQAKETSSVEAEKTAQQNLTTSLPKTEQTSPLKKKMTDTGSSKRPQLSLDLKKSKSESKRSDSSSPDQKITSKTKTESMRKKSPTEARYKKQPLAKVPSNSSRGRSPLRSEAPGSRDATPSGRSCCNRDHSAVDNISSKVSPILRKRPSNERMKVNATNKKVETPTKTTSRFEPVIKNVIRKTVPASNDRSYIRKTNNRYSPRKDVHRSPKETTVKSSTIDSREPIVDIPQTPLTDETKENHADSFPLIEDVTSEPNLPYHSIHRPSLVKEPVDSPSTEPKLKSNQPKSSTPEKKVTKPTKPFERRGSDKKVISRSNSSNIEKKPLGRESSIKRDKDVKSRLFSQIIPKNKVDDFLTPKKAVSVTQSVPSTTNQSLTDSSGKRKPVIEPLVVSKHIHKLYDDTDSVPGEQSSPTSPERPHPLSLNIRRSSSKEDKVDRPNVTPSFERSKSPLSKNMSPHPRSKESSPSPFFKEDSPSRFATGRPIDDGVNINKIKRLERNNSNKKLIYEDLEESASNLPGYLSDIEYITDLNVLETLLQKAQTYEERRVIRGHIRTLKKSSSGMASATTKSSMAADKFIKFCSTSTTNQPKFTATPKKVATISDESVKRFQPKKEPLSISTDRSKFRGSVNSRKLSSEDSTSKRKISVEKKTRKISAEETKQKLSTEETVRRVSIDKSSRKSSVEDSKTKPLSDESYTKKKTSTGRKISEEMKSSRRKVSSEEQQTSKRKSSSTEEESTITKRKNSIEESKSTVTKRKTSSESVRSSARKVVEDIRKYSGQSSSEENKSETTVSLKKSIFDGKTSTKKKSDTNTPSSSSYESRVKTTRNSQSRFSSPRIKSSYDRKKDTIDEPYIEPLRHQKASTRITTVSQLQTDVEKIISPYGVGPTDENGLPLIGLKALKRRAKPQYDAPEPDPIAFKEPVVDDNYEPTDTKGRSLFGIGALRKSPPEKTTFTATQVAKETSSIQECHQRATVVTEENYLAESVSSTQPIPFKTEIVNVTNNGSDASSDDSQGFGALINDRKQRRLRKKMIARRRNSEDIENCTGSNQSSDSEQSVSELPSVGETSPALVKSIDNSLRRRQIYSSDTDEERSSSRIKNIITLHEDKVAVHESSPPQPITPKKVLRNSFQPTNETLDSKTHRTWDLETDLSTRSDLIGNIITKHENLTKQDSAKILTGILKKSSITSTTSPVDADFDAVEAIAKSSELERKTSYTEIKISNSGTKKDHQTEKSSTSVLESKTSYQSTTRDEEASSDFQQTEGNFLDNKSKVTGINDVLSRMSASTAVDHETTLSSDEQARSLLNKFLGAQVLMTGVESMMASSSQSSSSSSMTKSMSEQKSSYSSSSKSQKVEESDVVKGVNINEVTDDFALNQLLDSCEEYDERRRVRMRLKALMVEKKALQKGQVGHDYHSSSRRVAGVSGSKGLESSEGGSSYSISRGSSQVTSQSTSFSQNMRTLPGKDGGASAFNKFKQMDTAQPKTSSSKSGPLFQLSTSLHRSASGVKDILLTWCQCRTRDYKGVKIENFSTSWNDGLAFCALIHHFYPDAFDFNSLDSKNRRHNFSLAFRVADDKAGIMALLDVDDMVMMQKPDWKCVFTYVQSLYKRLKDE